MSKGVFDCHAHADTGDGIKGSGAEFEGDAGFDRQEVNFGFEDLDVSRFHGKAGTDLADAKGHGNEILT